jgi:hypothetical protein
MTEGRSQIIRPTFGAKIKKKQLAFQQAMIDAMTRTDRAITDLLRILTEMQALSKQDENYFRE